MSNPRIDSGLTADTHTAVKELLRAVVRDNEATVILYHAALRRDEAAIDKAVADRKAAHDAMERHSKAALAGLSALHNFVCEVEERAKVSPPAQTKKMSFWQPGQERYAQDAIDRVTSAVCREIEKRIKHADSDRGRFTGWMKGYLATGGKLHQYAARAVASIVGDDGAERVARDICRWTLRHFDCPADPAEQLSDWQEYLGHSYGMTAICNERYDAGCKQIEARQLAACT